ncbi:MAG: glycosyltransferase family 9 protein, partial [Armatimonadetes bacterium]|nr:glycosyltransferase family 9 protein [Armatimonadota bacterium]
MLLTRRSSMGDIILTMPTLVALRRGFPDAYIAWMVDSRFREIIEGHDCLDEVIPVLRYPGHAPIRFLRETIQTVRVLRERKFDMTVDTHGLLKSSALCLLSGAPRRIGFDDERREFNCLCTNERAPGNSDIHAVDRYLMMAEYLNCPTKPIEFRLPIAEASQNWADRFIEENKLTGVRPLVGLNLGASRPHRRWPTEYFAQLAEALCQDEQACCVLIGGPGDRKLSESVQQQLTVPTIDAVGQTTLGQLPALIQRCDVLVSSDSG